MKSDKPVDRIFETIFNNTYNFTGLLDEHGTLVKINNSALEFGGLSRKDVLGKKIWETPWLSIEKSKGQIKSAVGKAVKGKFIQIEIDIAGSENNINTIDFSLKPVGESKNDTRYLIAEGRDITSRKQLESDLIQTNEILTRTQKAAKIGSWRVDLKDLNVFWSAEVYRIHELAVTSKIEISRAIEFYREDFRQIIEKHIQQAKENKKRWDIEAVLITAKGKEKWVRAIGYPVLKDGEVIALEGLFQDIHEKKVVEIKYKELNQNLEMKVAKRTIQLDKTNQKLSKEIEKQRDIDDRLKKSLAELKKAKESAESVSSAKTRFLANMSHEIRTPLNSIIGLGHLISKTSLNPKQEEYFGKIISSGKALLFVINDILDISKMESEKLELEVSDFDMEEVFQRLADGNAFIAENKGLELVMGIDSLVPTKLVGDPKRLSQILNNLCKNAIKFTDGGEVSVKATLVENIEDRVKIQFIVSDTGIGMKKKFLENLFLSFNQADYSISRKFGGSGLGLSIVKGLVNLMGGSVNVTSQIGKGSQFAVDLWFNKQAKQREINPSTDLRKMDILITDDNRSSLNVLKQALRSFTFNVTTSSSGSEALEILKRDSKKFKIILLDWKMPGMDGLHTAKEIRNTPGIEKIPIVIMCNNYTHEEVLVQKERLGLEGLLVKPARYSKLYNSIVDIVKNRNGGTIKINEESDKAERNLRKELVNRKILLAEDNEINQEVAVELLKEYGFKVDIANNGMEAVKMVFDSGNPSRYDLVLMDLQMPVMSGFEATEKIRSKEVYDTLPIVAMTADVVLGMREKCLKVGMQEYITKPIDPERMINVISNWMKPKKESLHREQERQSNLNQDSGNIKDEVLIPDFNLIEVEDGLMRVAGNTKLYLKLLRKFMDKNEDFTKELNDKISSGDQDGSRRFIHSLKGTAGNLGMMQLYETCKELEIQLNDSNGVWSSENRYQLENELNLVMKELRTKLKNDNHEGRAVISYQKASEFIAPLIEMLSHHDAEALTLFEKIGIVESHESEFEQIGKAIKQYDFAEAISLLKNLKFK